LNPPAREEPGARMETARRRTGTERSVTLGCLS
jgi:hypothetical protein